MTYPPVWLSNLQAKDREWQTRLGIRSLVGNPHVVAAEYDFDSKFRPWVLHGLTYQEWRVDHPDEFEVFKAARRERKREDDRRARNRSGSTA